MWWSITLTYQERHLGLSLQKPGKHCVIHVLTLLDVYRDQRIFQAETYCFGLC